MSWSPEALIDGCARVVARSPWVCVDEAAVSALAAAAPPIEPPRWDDPGMLRGPPERQVAWLLAYNAINFSYWPDAGPRWRTVVGGVEVGGDDEALGIMVAFAAALERGVPLDDPAWLTRVDAATLEALLPAAPGAGRLPLFDARVAGLRELGRGLAAYGGAAGLVRAAAGSAVALVDGIVAAFPSWEDVRADGGDVLVFRKRAQLCTAMIAGALGGVGLGAFHDVARLTVFADYRLPQILRGTGVIALEDGLAARIARGDALAKGSVEETAIRAATVYAAERLRVALAADQPAITALDVDHLLWRLAVDRQDHLPPFHHTRGTDY